MRGKYSCVEELRRAGTTVIMSSHREDEVAKVCDKRIGLSKGRMVGETLRLNGFGNGQTRAAGEGSQLHHGREA